MRETAPEEINSEEIPSGQDSDDEPETAEEAEEENKVPDTPEEETDMPNDTDTENEERVSALPGAGLNGDSFAGGEAPLRVTYAEGFYYEPVSDALKEYITGSSYPDTDDESGLAISCGKLCYVHVLHSDFEGNTAEGELICNEAIAEDLVEIFYELWQNGYPIEQIRLVDEYGGDDDASMAADNTSCFNYRNVSGSSSLSKHALGRAVDINPLYNPYITYDADGSQNVSPPEGRNYVDRSADFAYRIDTSDLCYRLFTEHGFTWGGSWNSCKDYQHFQK